jgi:hypothetical protein
LFTLRKSPFSGANVLQFECDNKVPRKLIEGDLRSGVGTVERPGCVQRCRGRKVHDPAPTPIDHAVQKRAGHEIGSHRVDHERFNPLLGIAVLDQGDRSEDPRGVDEHSGPAELGFDGGLEAGDISRVRNIRRKARRAARDFCYDQAARLERIRDSPSDAATRSGEFNGLTLVAFYTLMLDGMFDLMVQDSEMNDEEVLSEEEFFLSMFLVFSMDSEGNPVDVLEPESLEKLKALVVDQMVSMFVMLADKPAMAGLELETFVFSLDRDEMIATDSDGDTLVFTRVDASSAIEEVSWGQIKALHR